MPRRVPDPSGARFASSPNDPDLITRPDEGRGKAILEAAPVVPAAKLQMDDLLPEIATADRKYILGDFQLLRPVGRGGMGVVYEARQLSLQKRVAVKVLPISSVLEQRLVQRFQNEAWAAARLDHTNIVPVYHVGYERGIHFYVMQFIEGQDLAKIVRDLQTRQRRRADDALSVGKADPEQPPGGAGAARAEDEGAEDFTAAITGSVMLDTLPTPAAPRPPLLHASTQRASKRNVSTLVSDQLKSAVSQHGSTSHPDFLKILLRLGIQAAEALEYAHQMGVIHRDIKPSNLMLDVKGNLWVTDFGLAQIQNGPSVTVTGDMVGTLRYMSPEQAFGKRVSIDHRTDIYSLGVTLYELLTLTTAFGAESREAVLRQIAFDDPVAPRKIDRRIPIELETIVMKAISKNPDERYQSAAEFAEDLRRFRDDEPIVGRRPGLRQRMSRWAKRHRSAVAAAAGVGGITFISAIIIALLSWSYYAAAAVMLETEKQQNALLADSLQTSEGLRLAANASLQLSESPGRSLALALEGSQRFASSEASEAILAALDRLHERHTFFGHSSVVGTVAVSPDGAYGLSTAPRLSFDSEPEPARLWNLTNGGSAGVLQDDRTITSAAFSPDRFRVLTTASPPAARAIDDIDDARSSNHVHLWDSVSQRKLISFADAFLFEAHAEAFDPDGRRLVLPAYGNAAKVYDTVAGHEVLVLVGHQQRVVFAAFDPSGERVVTVSDDHTIRLWDGQTGQQLLLLDYLQSSGGQRQPLAVDRVLFTRDGTRLAFGSPLGVQLWDLETGDRINQEYWPGSIVGLSRDGSRLLSQPHLYQLQWRDTHSGDVVRTIEDRDEPLARAVLSPDGRSVAVIGIRNVLRVFDLHSGRLLASMRGHESELTDVAYSPDSNQILSGSMDRTARYWDLRTDSERASLPQHFGAEAVTAISPDGQLIAVARQPVEKAARFRLGRPNSLSRFDSRSSLPNPNPERFLAVAGDRLDIRSSTTGESVASFAPQNFTIANATINPAGDRVAIVSKLDQLLLWSPGDGSLRTLDSIPASITAIAFDQSQRLTVGDTGGRVRIWDADTGELAATLRHNGGVSHCEFGADDAVLLVATQLSEVTLWDAESLEKIRTIRNAPDRFNHASLSFDGQYVITHHSSSSTGALCWDAATGELVSRLEVAAGLTDIALAPGRHEAVIASQQSGTIFWDYVTEESRVLSAAPAGQVRYSSHGDYFVSSTAEPRYVESSASVAPENYRVKFHRWFRDDLDNAEVFDVGLAAVRSFDITPDDWIIANYRQHSIAVHRVDTMNRLVSLAGHDGPIRFLAFAENNRLVSASWDHTAALWDAGTGVRRLLMDDHTAPVTAASLLADGRRLLTSSSTGETIFWNADSGRALQRFMALPGGVRYAHLNARGDHALLIGPDGQHALYQLADQQTVAMPAAPTEVRWAEFSPDGQKILYLPKSSHAHWPAPSGIRRSPAQDPTEQPAQDPTEPKPVLVIVSIDATATPLTIGGTEAQTAHFHPDGNSVLMLLRDHRLVLVDVATGEALASWDDSVAQALSPTITAIVSPDGKSILSAGIDSIRIWDPETGRIRFTLSDHGVSRPAEHTLRLVDSSGKWFFSSRPGQRITRWPLYPSQYANAVAPRGLTPQEQRRYGLKAFEELLEQRDRAAGLD